MEHIVIYRSPEGDARNPDIAKLANGELVVVFRESPRRRKTTLIDPLSRAMLVRSLDNGRTWDKAAPVTVARGGEHTGIQDPSVCVLRNKTLLCHFFTWYGPPDAPYGAEVVGTFAAASEDGGQTWNPKHIMVEMSAHAGGFVATSDAAAELPDGEILLPVYDNKLTPTEGGGHRSVVFRSTNGGDTWAQWGTLAYDPLGSLDFTEPALAALPSGKVIAVMREERQNQCLWQSESMDGGRTWTRPRRTVMWGQPADLLVLKSGKLLCTYGYRRPPYGVRACLSHDEGKTWDLANELVIRADAPSPDVGYPSSVQLGDGSILTVYYMDEPGEGVRYVAGSFYKEW